MTLPVRPAGPLTGAGEPGLDAATGGLQVDVVAGNVTSAPTADATTVTHVASVTLAAAGADLTFNGTNYPNGRLSTGGAPRVTFKWAYSAGGTGGYPGHHAEFSDGTKTWRQEVTDSTLSPSTGGEATRQKYLVEDLEPAGMTAGEYTVDIPRGVTSVRLVPREVGNTGSPGTYSATASLGWAGAQ